MRLPPYPNYKPSGVEWLAHVPEHWDVKRGRFCMDVNPSSPRMRTLRPDDEVSFVPMEAVGEYGGLELGQTRAIADVGSGYTEFEDGDVLVAKITPCFENGKGALATGLLNGAAFGTTELHVLRAAPILERRFLFYFSISRLFRSTGEGEMYGAGGQKRVPPKFCENVRLPLPPIDDQRAIADFLDRETAKIDTLVAKKRTLIERLKEKRTALISRTVTRGLPPDAARAARLDPHPKLKPSGIDWLGAVPEHWRITRLSRVVACLDGRRIPLNREERSERQGPYPYWGANGIVDSVDEWLFDEPLVLLGEDGAPFFALNKEVAFFVTGKIWVNNHAHVLRPFAGIDGEFLAHALNHTEYGAFIDGSTRDKLTQDDMNAIPIATPPHAEQRAIARFLDRETAKIDTMIATVETAIERLQEYRTALITAAVTGKIDVRALSGADAAGTMTP
jgi:type I restriction enzyme S subunit